MTTLEMILFMRILSDVEAHDVYFTQRNDALSRQCDIVCIGNGRIILLLGMTHTESISHSTSGKEILFAMKYEATRKDMERAFSILQSRWTITHGPVRFWKKNDLCKIMKTCIILHNMIIEDERQTNLEPWVPLQEENIELPAYARDPALLGAHIASRLDRIRNKEINNTLRSDLFEHV
ncbi:hypothetical protein ACOSQ2_023711 [Xanthoceras sorbifolium]